MILNVSGYVSIISAEDGHMASIQISAPGHFPSLQLTTGQNGHAVGPDALVLDSMYFENESIQ